MTGHSITKPFWAVKILNTQLFKKRPQHIQKSPVSSRVSLIAEMAETESTKKQSYHGELKEEEDDDYMGDLSQFISPETSNPTKSSLKKVSSLFYSI